MVKGIFGVLLFAGIGFIGVFFIYPLNTPAAGVLASLFAPMALHRALGVSLSTGPLAAQAAKSMPLGGLIGFLCFDFLWGACLLIYCELLFDDAGRSCCFCRLPFNALRPPLSPANFWTSSFGCCCGGA